MVVITMGSTASAGLFHLAAAAVLLDHLPCWNPGGGSGFQLRSCWDPDKSCGLHCRLWRDGSDYIPAGSVGPAAGSLWITSSLFYWLFFACFCLGARLVDLLQQLRVETKPSGSGTWNSRSFLLPLCGWLVSCRKQRYSAALLLLYEKTQGFELTGSSSGHWLWLVVWPFCWCVCLSVCVSVTLIWQKEGVKIRKCVVINRNLWSIMWSTNGLLIFVLKITGQK